MRPSFVESFVVEAIKDEELPGVETALPADFSLIRSVMEYCPSVVVEPYRSQDSLPFDNPGMIEPSGLEGLRLRQITSFHARSFEIVHPAFSGAWTDEHGHEYGSVNLKGNNFSYPAVLESGTATERVIAYGLQESVVMRRVLRASRLLREHGVSTEYILGMAEPKEYPWPRVDNQTEYTDRLPLPEYKRRLVEEHWKLMEDNERTAEALVELSAKFDRMTFFVTMRAMDTSIRLGDVRASTRARQEIFRYINEHTSYGQQHPLNSLNPAEVKRYANEFLVPRIVKNIAGLHKMGLAHKYANELNITALGSIVDLDSVHGETLELDDEPITARDAARDIVDILWALDATLYGESRFNLASKTWDNDADPRMTFLRLYQEAMKTDDADKPVELQAVNVLAEACDILEHSRSNSLDLSFSTPDQICSKVQEAIIEKLSPEQLSHAHDFVSAWADTELPKLKPLFENELKTNVREYIRVLFDEYINELHDADFDVVGVFFGEDKGSRNDVYRMMLKDLSDIVHSEFAGFVSKLSVYSVENGTVLPLPPSVYSLYLSRLLSERNDAGLIWGPIKELVKDTLPLLREQFEESSKLVWPARIFPELHAFPVLRSSQNVFIMETEGVAISELADYLETSDEELVIEPMDHSDDIHENNFVVTGDGSILIEFISDSGTNGLSQDVADDEIFRNLRYSVPNGQYLLFVEQKPDNTRRLRIHLKDEELAERLSPAPRASIVQAFRTHYSVPGHLFNPSKYDKTWSAGEWIRTALDFYVKPS